MGDKKQLTRALTFDDRRLNADSYGSERFVKFTKSSQRSLTFIDKSEEEALGGKKVSTSGLRDRSHSLTVEDVMYRKHFGLTGDELKKPFSSFHTLPSVVRDQLPLSNDTILRTQPLESLIIRDKAVVVVDTFTTGAMLANTLFKQGYQVICVLSGDLKDLLKMVPEGLEVRFLATIVYDIELEDSANISNIIRLIRELNIEVVAVFAGAETGVELADTLSEVLHLRTNGTALSEARRNKYVMGETIRSAGLRAVKQLRATTWIEIESWLSEWNPDPFKVIVKPMDSAGSDDVTLCLSWEEVRNAFGNIMGKVNGLGIVNKAVLVQEYLEGQEYVLDMVSRDGEHKVAAIWAYDRRPINGAGFVCFGQRLLTADEPHCRELIDYQKRVITALGIRNGPTHGEVKWCKGEPVLVEVGARCHGGDGLWVGLATECFGYNQVQCTIDAYLKPEDFDLIPDEPIHRKAYGCTKWLINYRSGRFLGINERDMNLIRSSDAYRGNQIFLQVGCEVIKTQNCFSWGGCVLMAHTSEQEVQRLYDSIELMERETLFEIDNPMTVTSPESSVVDGTKAATAATAAVVIVDPFSTGAVIAADLHKQGYAVVVAYSANLDQLVNLTGLVPSGVTVSFAAIVPFDDDVLIMKQRLLSLTTLDIIAVLPGAETGVELADTLSEVLHLRTNGTALSEARRNKYVMGETIRSAGLRAVKQLRATTWIEIESWLSEWNPDPFKVIVKPMDSAGSDDVTLCLSWEEVRNAFGNIMGKVNGLGIVNKAVLVQEYLEGQEYVLDMVSRDGEHKVAAIWAYDRRPINGAGFVLFGQRLLTADEPHCRELIDYQKRVITALGIRNGPTHGEVKWCKGEPVLVEVGARCHGAEGVWQQISDAVYGYNQVQCSIDAYFDEKAFNTLPLEPTVRRAYGILLFLVLYETGIVRDIDNDRIDEIQALSSFVSLELFVQKGALVRRTVDCFTWGGVVKLISNQQDVIEGDYNTIRNIEKAGFLLFT